MQQFSRLVFVLSIVLATTQVAFAESASVLYESAVDLIQKNETEKALEILNKGIADNPTAANLYQLRGELQCNKENYLQALSDAEKAIELSKQDPKSSAYLGKAKAEWYLKRIDDADRDFKIAIEKNPANHLAHAIYGDFLFSQGKNTEALKSLITARDLACKNNLDGCERIQELIDRISSADTEKTRNEAKALAGSEQIDKAIARLDKGIVENPGIAKFYYMRGALFATQKKYDEALKDQDKAIELSKDNTVTAGAYLNKALTYVNLKQDEQAEANFKKALEFKPDLDVIHLEYGKLLFTKGDNENAAIHLDKAIRSPSGTIPNKNLMDMQALRDKLKKMKETQP
ncbi:MAG: tetratricopeptide repeat protein [Candidatus Melainabacteria bacterium]|nr:tetratricopeptide repeat protein [Candidatus Melainabacteria bacterium]